MVHTAASIGSRPFVYGWHHGWGGGWWFLFAAVCVLLVLTTVSMARGFARPRRSETPARESESGIEILDRRYARGEIDADEYRSAVPSSIGNRRA